MAPLYKPPIKGTTTETPWLSMVLKAEPDFERQKHRVPEYLTSGGKVFRGDPPRRGAYNTPSKINFVTYTGPVTLAAGDITGVGYDFVTLISEGTAPGTFTTRTAAEMFGDIPGAVPNIGFALRVVNRVLGGTMTLARGAGVVFVDRSGYPQQSLTVKPLTYSDYRVQFPDAAGCVVSVDSFNSPYSALVG